MKSILKNKIISLIILDVLVIFASVAIAFLLRFDGSIPSYYGQMILPGSLIITLITLPFLFRYRMYSFVWEQVSANDILRLAKSLFISFVIFLAFIYFIPGQFDLFRFPRSVVMTTFALILLLSGSVRFSHRIWEEFFPNQGKKKMIIVGIDNADMVVRSAGREGYGVLGIFDPSGTNTGSVICGVEVSGDSSKWQNYDVDTVCVASNKKDVLREAYILAKNNGVDSIKRANIIQGYSYPEVSFENMDMERVLGRKEIIPDDELLKKFFNNKKIVITGGGGSIGSTLAEYLKNYSPANITLVDISEYNIFQVEHKLGASIDSYLADVKDEESIRDIFDKCRPDVVFHTAASKHVPLSERNVREAMRNNILGTKNVLKASGDFGVEKVVFISTDKAVLPSSVMGKTKKVGEMLVRSMNEKYEDTDMVAVRFGNVLNSRGSVIPTFRDQITKGGPVTVTHPNMERFFMAIREACLLVMEASAIGQGGDLFVLDMGKPVKISKLAENMISFFGQNVEIKYTKPRSGEKLTEELSEPEEVLEQTDQRKIFRVRSSKGVDEDKLENLISKISTVRGEEKSLDILNEILRSEKILVQKV